MRHVPRCLFHRQRYTLRLLLFLFAHFIFDANSVPQIPPLAAAAKKGANMSYQAYNFSPIEIDTAMRYIRTPTGEQQLIHTMSTWTPTELRIAIRIKQSFRRQYSRSRGLTEIEELLFAVWRLREHRNYYVTASVAERIRQQRAVDVQRVHHRKRKPLRDKIIACITDIDRLREQGYDYPTIATILKKVHEKMFARRKIDPNYLGKVYRSEKNRLAQNQSIM